MFEDPDLNRFVYILIGAIIAAAALWLLVISPMEKRTHQRKLAMLQKRIRNRENRSDDVADKSVGSADMQQ